MQNVRKLRRHRKQIAQERKQFAENLKGLKKILEQNKDRIAVGNAMKENSMAAEANA